MVTCMPHSHSQHPRFKNLQAEISHDAIVIESLIFLSLSSFCPENSTLVKVFHKIGLIYSFLSITPLILGLETITISPARIPFPVLGHKYIPLLTTLSFSLLGLNATKDSIEGHKS